MAGWSLEVLSPHGEEGRRWRQWVEASPPDKQDVYFMPEFAVLYEKEFKEPTSMIRFGDDSEWVLMVLARRSVAELPFLIDRSSHNFSSLGDVTSPFGYCEPIVYSPNPDGEARLFKGFREAFHSYCLETGVVAEFLRLHPLMENHRFFGSDPGLFQKNCTVWIDLRQSESEILRGMKNDPRRSVRVAEEQGVEVFLSDLRPSHLEEYYRLYTLSMERLNALPMYFFSLEFFQDFVSLLGRHTALFLAWWKGKVISAHVFFHCGRYVDLYLAGSDPEHWRLKANALNIYHAALWAREQGYHCFHLGGGHAVELDGVFHFKSQFSSGRKPYYMYRHIHDQKAYDQLCQAKREFDESSKAEQPTSKDPVLMNYFPAYRG